MAMIAADMAQNIVNKIKLRNPQSFDSGEEALLLDYWTDVCQGIIDEIIDGAVVQVDHDGTRTGSVTS